MSDNILTNTQGREYYIYRLGMLADKLQSRIDTLESSYKNIYGLVDPDNQRPYTINFRQIVNKLSIDKLDFTNDTTRQQFANTIYYLYKCFYGFPVDIVKLKEQVIEQLHNDFHMGFSISDITLDTAG